jgi:Tol biopolymer transport system component
MESRRRHSVRQHRLPAVSRARGGGAAVAVTRLDEGQQETTYRWPSFLPDGQHFLYTARSQRPEYHGVYVGSLESGDRTRLVNALSNAIFATPGFLIFARDGDVLAQRFDPDRLELAGDPVTVVPQVLYNLAIARASFMLSAGGLLAYQSASDNAAASVVAVGREGRQLDVIGRGYAPALSPDGVRVAVERIEADTGTADVWVIDTARRIDTPLTRHPAYDENAVWSPDGLDLVFSSQREGPGKLFHAPASGNGPDERLTDSATFNRPTHWSADGRFIAYTNADSRTNLDLWALPLFGDRKPFPIARSEFREAQGHFSPDGR